MILELLRRFLPKSANPEDGVDQEKALQKAPADRFPPVMLGSNWQRADLRLSGAAKSKADDGDLATEDVRAKISGSFGSNFSSVGAGHFPEIT